jgi:hypothetical protein|nr:MAG TPA: hypothetical protein [Caudoviricetes sp.]
MARKFTWDVWNYDFDGDAYIIAKDQCPEKENIPDFICRVDDLDPACKPDMVVEEGWCKWQVRSDWEDGDGTPQGWYVVEKQANPPRRLNGQKQPGWFPVWIVRRDEWY